MSGARDLDARLILAPGSRDSERDDSKAAEITERKLAAYNAHHATKKSRKEKEDEAAAKRAREHEEETAALYNDFVAAFDADEDGPSGTSVRSRGKGFVRAGGDGRYNPLADRPSAPPPVPTGPKVMSIKPGQNIPTGPKASYTRPSHAPAPPIAAAPAPPSLSTAFDDDMEEDLDAPSRKLPPGRKKRDMDHFLDELKSQQKTREDRLRQHVGRSGSSVTALAAKEHASTLSGSYDTGDPLTTNMHVGNLPQTVDEQSLGMLFAKFGPVGSVKIMWPRLDGSTIHRPALGGFVAMLRRPDAENAARELEGFDWGGNVLRISWGKAVPLPARALYEIEGVSKSRLTEDKSKSRRSRRSRSRSHSPRQRSRSPRRRSRSTSRDRRRWPKLEDDADEKLMSSIARKFRERGRSFEEIMRQREQDNPKYAFLRDDKLPSYHHFLMLQNSRYQPPQKFFFSDEGDAEAYSSDSAEDSDNEMTRKGDLGRLATRRFEIMLRGLTSTREKIARAMAFALEHADASSTIVDIIIGSLSIDTTPVPRKVARLHLISDILHNCASAVPNAWVYRSTFEGKLGEVFDHLGEIYLSFPGRMKAEQYRSQITAILDVWEHEWMVFDPRILDDYRRRLAGEGQQAEAIAAAELLNPQSAIRAEPEPEATVRPKGFTASGFKSATFTPSAANDALDEEEDLDGAMVTAVDEDDLDGEAVAGDDDGEAMQLSGADD